MVRVDILVVGGGLQGLLLLDRFMRDGRSCALLTDSDLGSGQTLHSHGLLNTGFGFAGPGLREVRDLLVLPFLTERGIVPYGDWFLLSPDEEAVGEPATAGSLPPGFTAGGAHVRRLAELNFPKRQLVWALGSRHRDRIVRGRVAGWHGSRAIESIEVELASGDQITFAPSAVVAATGTGTKRFITALAGATGQFDNVRHRRVHMLCVRGPAALLPAISVLSLQHRLNLVAHRREAMVTWYSTPFQDDDPHFAIVPDDAVAAPEPDVLADGLRRLESLFPPLSAIPELRFSAYAGFRQDIGETVGTPACEPVEGMDNLLVALPSLAVNAWANAVTAAGIVEGMVGSPTSQPEIPYAGASVRVGRPPEERSSARWSTWSELRTAQEIASRC